jgi:formamidopyrimidine-DNA glycosylase
VPELPEVEVVRRDLAAEVAGSIVVGVSVTGVRSVRRQDPEQLVHRVTGAELGPPGRVGKYLTIPLDHPGEDVLVVHLRMSGRLVLAAAGDPLARHTHAVIQLSDGRELRFVDPRTFGELFVTRSIGGTGGAGGRPPELAHLGPDPLDPSFCEAVLRRLVADRRARLKPLLMDQRRLAGLGNIYSDEALFRAGLRFDRPAGALTLAEVSSLHAAITATLAEAVEHRGSSLRDAQYVDLFGRPGGYQSHHRVYAREGRPCPRCHRPVVRRRFANRSTFFCEACQS